MSVIFLSQLYVQDTRVRILGIRSDKGKIMLHVFKDAQSYEKQEPYKTIHLGKDGLSAKGSLVRHINLQSGVYGITLVDDENDNGEIERNVTGMPKEGIGYSDFYPERIKKASFEDFKVNLEQKHALDIRVKYL